MASSVRALVGAAVRTMDPAGAEAEAVAWRDGEIVAVGSASHVRDAAGPDAEVVDVGGAAVLPGFVDAHHHVGISMLYAGVVHATPPAVIDIESFQRLLADASRSLEVGRWLVVMDWDEQRLAERRPPTREELDEAVPDRPLFALHYTCHRAVANSRALELAGIDRHTPEPSGGRIGRGRGGHPDGLLVERGMSPVESRARADLIGHDREGFLARLAAHYRELAAVGITRVADAAVPHEMISVFRESAHRGEVIVPTVLFPTSTTGWLEEPWDALDGPPTGETDGPLTIGPIKLIFDGGTECSMCTSVWQTLGVFAGTLALAARKRSLDPVRTTMSVKPRLSGAELRTGIAIYRPDEGRRVVRGVLERGFAVATHAIGNAAIDVALSAYAEAGPRLHRPWPARIEHAAFASREQVRRIAGEGIAVATQPHLVSMDAFDVAPSVPGLRLLPLRWMLDAGVAVAGSSDYPVTGFDPLDGIRSAVLRRSASGRVLEGDQRIDLEEALAMYTRKGAELCGCGDRTGSLEPGKRADLVVLDGPLSSLGELEQARVRATVIGGQLQYGDPAG